MTVARAEIESFFETHRSLYAFLLERGEPTFASEANNNFRRSLVLAIASHFEHEVSMILRAIPEKHASGHPFICSMIEQKVISGQFHRYFVWDQAKNANKFFSLFGPAFRTQAEAAVKGDTVLDQAIRDFLELGDTRNRLVHRNYVAFDVDKTPEDIMKLFRSAEGFMTFLRAKLLDETHSVSDVAAASSPDETAVAEGVASDLQ